MGHSPLCAPAAIRPDARQLASVLLGEQRASNPRLRRSNRLTGAAAHGRFVPPAATSSSGADNLNSARSSNGLRHRPDKAKTKVRLLLGLSPLGDLCLRQLCRSNLNGSRRVIAGGQLKRSREAATNQKEMPAEEPQSAT